MLLTSVICFTYFSVYAETNTLKAGILDDYSFDGNSTVIAEDSDKYYFRYNCKYKFYS